jgi:integrase
MSKNADLWTKSAACLYRYKTSGTYHARVRFGGKLHRQTLDTTDYQLARRRLAKFRKDLGSTNASLRNTSMGEVLDRYERTLNGLSVSSQKDKRAICAKIRAAFGKYTPIRDLKTSDVEAWLSRRCGGKSPSYHNSCLTVFRDVFELAVRDRIIAESPVAHLQYRKRSTPIRKTPSFDDFKAIVQSIRSQEMNRNAEQSADFVEFLGLAGLGQAEVRAITRGDCDLEAGLITTFRHKTRQGFAIPIYPQLRPLVEKLCEGKAHNERLFKAKDAEKALKNACARLGLPAYSHRALRRMFITRAIERGVDVKVIADWQGHRDGGKLILQTYSHVRPVHSQRMAQLMTTEQPENIIQMEALGAK